MNFVLIERGRKKKNFYDKNHAPIHDLVRSSPGSTRVVFSRAVAFVASLRV